MVKLKKSTKSSFKTMSKYSNKNPLLKDPKSINKLKNHIRRHNPDVFHFNLDSKFIYESRYCSFFFIKLSVKNKMKPNQEELNFLIDYEKNFSLNTNKEENQNYIFIIKDYFHYCRSQKIIKPILDNRALQIDSLLKARRNEKISCRKLSELYFNTYNKNISRQTINRILRNQLGFKYLKIIVKNKKILKENSIAQSFFVLKILIRHLKFWRDIIYIDESTFYTKNNNYKTWRKSEQYIFHDFNDSSKRNLILAVSSRDVVYWELNDLNIKGNDFIEFIGKMIQNIAPSERKNFLVFMDNASIHSSFDAMKFYFENGIKILFNVPYVSFFNMVELCFRAIKKLIYELLFSSINEVEKKIEEILDGEKLKKQIPLLFKETLREYIKYIEENQKFNLNNI